MVGDVGELVVEQPRVDGVEHPAHPDRAVPGGQMVDMVHRQRGDAVAGLHARAPRAPAPCAARRGRRSGQLVRVIVPSPQAETISRVAMLALGMVDQAHDAQRPILHRAQSYTLVLPANPSKCIDAVGARASRINRSQPRTAV